jgi:hypothetical protein
MKVKLLFASLLLCSIAPAQSTTTYNFPGSTSLTITISAEALASLYIRIPLLAPPGVGNTTVATAYTSGGSTIDVTSATGYAIGMGITVDSEFLLITGISSNTLTVTGAQLGTTAASHSLGAVVTIARSGNVSYYVKSVLADDVTRGMLQTPGPVIAGDQSSIASAIAAAVN